jgi:pyridoxamine 5'-phosphate oxidase
MTPDKQTAELRQHLARGVLSEENVDPDPFAQFQRWFDDAVRAHVHLPNAMALATATHNGRPSVRTVLLKMMDQRGFVFFTNYESKKSSDLRENPFASLLFHWSELERQVRIDGSVERTTRQEAEEYFKTRPYESKLSAWASPQSEVLSSRLELEKMFEQMRLRYPDEVPLPPTWGGFRLIPEMFEFWQGRENRLHDRIRYRKLGQQWIIERLAP